MNLKILVVILLLLSGIPDCFSQPISFRHLSVEEGLSNNLVNVIYKDSFGFVWFGTLDGLDRFDGVEVRNYASDFPEVVDNVFAITEDRNHNLWVGTATGLFRFNTEGNNFIKIQPDSITVQVRTLSFVTKDTLLVGTNQGLFLLNTRNNQSKRILFSSQPDDPQNAISGMEIDLQNNCWLATSGGLIRYQPLTGTFSRVESPLGDLYNAFTSVSRLDDVLYLGTSGAGLVSYHLNTGQFAKVIDIGNRIVLALSHDKIGHLYVGTNGGGLVIVDTRDQKIERIINQDDTPLSISSNAVYSILLDEEQRFWIGTYSGGVSFSQPSGGNFRIHPITNTYPEINKSIRSFYFNPDGSKLLGTRNGLIYLDRNGDPVFFSGSAPDRNGLRSNIILSVYPYKGDVLVGTYGGGVSRFSPARKQLEAFRDEEVFLNGNTYGFETDKAGNLWVASFNGIYLFNQENGRSFHFDNRNSPLTCNEVFDLAIDSRGRLWVGTRNGIFVFIEKGGELIPIGLPAELNFRYKINYIFEDRQHSIWICAERGGLYKIDSELKQVVRLDDTSGLPDNSVCAIIETGTQTYWISTLKGFCKYQAKTGVFTQYSISDGLPGLVFNPAAVCQTSNGTIWFGNEKGLVFFSPDDIDTQLPPSNIQLTDFYLLGKVVKPGPESVLKQALQYVEEIRLTDRQNSIGFRFVDLNFINPSDQNYLFKLEGFDKEWRKSGSENAVFYQKLKAGKYTFKVGSSNNSENNEPKNLKSVSIVIRRSVFRSPIFYLILLVVAVEVFFLLFNYIKSLQRVMKRLYEKPEKAEKYKYSKLSDKQSETIVSRIIQYMEEKKPYLNPELKLADLADELNLSQQEISQVINQSLNQGFADFVNHYRVEEFIRQIEDKAYEKLTLFAIAQQCGFNSKSSFYRIFKNEKGMTPADFLKQIETNE